MTVPLGTYKTKQKELFMNNQSANGANAHHNVNTGRVVDNMNAALATNPSGAATDGTEAMYKQYTDIAKAHGQAAANNWLDRHVLNETVNLNNGNQSIMRELQQKHSDIYSIPEVKAAIEAYLSQDMDLNKCLKAQGFPQAVDHVASIYKAGYNSGIGLKQQNDTAKSRMGSSVNQGMPSVSSGRSFTRADIKAMSLKQFAQNEKAIFDQLAKGLIK